ncbi:5'-methylthioadenosine/S-adenosylhomocysteine nucleosidase [Chloroflexota bacterium]
MNTYSKIGLITVRNESGPLLKMIDIPKETELMQARFFQGTLSGKEIVLAEVGMGKVPTAAGSQYLIDVHNVEILISCGSSGALAPDLQIGDVVLSERIVPHDFGETTDEKFNYLGVFDNTHSDLRHYYRQLTADPALLKTAQEAALSIEWPKNAPTIHLGCIASGDQIIASEKKKNWLAETLGAMAVEMESGAMAYVAFLNDIPWLAIRAVSDKADATIDFDFSEMVIYRDEKKSLGDKVRKTAESLADLAKDPKQIKDIINLGQGIKQAANNAARVTAAVIEQL